MDYDQLIKRLKSLKNPVNVAGMARFGITSKNTLGISVVALRKIAREIRKDHALALKLWASGIHEARILACSARWIAADAIRELKTKYGPTLSILDREKPKE